VAKARSLIVFHQQRGKTLVHVHSHLADQVASVGMRNHTRIEGDEKFVKLDPIVHIAAGSAGACRVL